MFSLALPRGRRVVLPGVEVEESPVFVARRKAPRQNPLAAIAANWKLAIYLVVLMTAFNFFSHGTQDLYPTCLQKQHHFGTHTTGAIAVIMNIGALVGALIFGSWSQAIGRRRAIMVSAMLALPIVPLWAYASGPAALAIGAFLIQMSVQGAWAMVPAYLNELSPPAVRAMFPGVVYQLGNLIASANSAIQARIAY